MCIDSVLAQTYKNYEVVLVDDGSTDGSGELCDKYAESYENIRVIHKANGGSASARNAGMEIAKGDYYTFVDSDDYIHPELFETLYLAAEKENADIAIAYIMVTEKCDEQFCVIDPEAYRVMNREEYWALRYSDHDSAIQLYMCPAKLYRKSAIKTIRFPDGKRHEDVFWLADYIQCLNKAVVFSYPMYYYFQRENSNMHSYTYMDFRDSLNAGYYLIETCQKHFSLFYKNEQIVFSKRYYQVLYNLKYMPLKEAKKLKRYYRFRYPRDKKFLSDIWSIGQRLFILCLNIESLKFVNKMADYHFSFFEYLVAHFNRNSIRKKQKGIID